jgi:hypothetical protein
VGGAGTKAQAPEASEPAVSAEHPASTGGRRRPSAAGTGGERPTGLDRIRPRPGPPTGRSRGAAGPADPDLRSVDLGVETDPLGKAALFSSGSERPPSPLGTFLVECSACRRETPVTAADLVRLGLPSIHLPLVKRYPSFMRCPACGRRTWVRVRWRL